MNVDLDMSGAPDSEFCPEFIVGMAKRMAMSYYKYGLVKDAYPHKVDAVRSLLARLDKYAQTGNTEYLMDAANCAMIEFMHPKHPDAHFEATDSKGSPGRQFHGEVDRSQRGNREI